MNVKCRNILKIYDKQDEKGHRFAIVSSTVEMNNSYIRIIFDNYEATKIFSKMFEVTFFMNKEIVATVYIERDNIYNKNYERIFENDIELQEPLFYKE